MTTLNLSNKSITKLDNYIIDYAINSLQLLESQETWETSIQTIIIDNNSLSKFEGLERFLNLRNVS